MNDIVRIVNFILSGGLLLKLSVTIVILSGLGKSEKALPLIVYQSPFIETLCCNGLAADIVCGQCLECT